MSEYVLTLLVATPLTGALIALLLPNVSWLRSFTVGVLALEVVWAVVLATAYNPAVSGQQLAQTADWISLSLGSLGYVSIDYALGVDGLNMALVVLAVLVLFIGAVSSWNIEKRPRGYFALYLLLSGSVVGCFVAQDFFLFYLFFEFMLLPMYFLIGMWGGPRREYAALKFFIYTFAGSLLILIAMIALYVSVIDPVETAVAAGLAADKASVLPEVLENLRRLMAQGLIPAENLVRTFRFEYLTDSRNYIPGSMLDPGSGFFLGNISLRALIFWFLFIGFAVKLPVVPVHTWLPDAHVEAPTPISVVLAGILLKIGGYGFIRIVIGFFPEEAFDNAVILSVLGMVSIVYGGFNALAQYDLKKMIAYSSVSHMGFVLLGVASFTGEGINGAIYQMVSHGILSSMLFLCAGVLYDRTHDRELAHYRGLIQPMPVYTIFTGIAFFASLGLPGFSGFVGELFTLMGSFRAPQIPFWIPALSTLGIVLAAMYFLWTYQRMYFGGYWYKHSKDHPLLPDLTRRELGMLAVLAVFTLLTGLFPNLLFHTSQATVQSWLEGLR